MSSAAARRSAIVIALVVGAWVVALAVLSGSASGGSRAEKAAPFAPSRLQAVRLSIGMRAVPRIAKQGQTVTYVLRISNVGGANDDPALLPLVCFQVPQGLTLVKAPPDFARRGGLVCRTFTRLTIGATAILDFRMKVSPSANVGVVVNTASVKARGMARAVKAQAQLRVVAPCVSRAAALRPLC